MISVMLAPPEVFETEVQSLKNRFADDRKQRNGYESVAEASRENGTLSDDLIYLSSHLPAKDLLQSM